jgi:hypothetical protein
MQRSDVRPRYRISWLDFLINGPGAPDNVCESKIGNVRMAVGIDQDISRLQVAMDQLLCVSKRYRVGNFGKNRRHSLWVTPQVRELLIQCLAIDVLADQEELRL